MGRYERPADSYERSEIRVRGTGKKLIPPFSIYDVFGRGKCELCEAPATVTFGKAEKRNLCGTHAGQDREWVRSVVDWANKHGDQRLAKLANRNLIRLEQQALLFEPAR